MISLNWVRDYLDIDEENLDELAVKITKAGVNVEKVIKNRIEHLVIGEVKDCQKHPDSDHLSVCKVDIGNEIVQIVCGAPNVKNNLKVLVALPGCILPGNFEIKASKIRGQESHGMICALYELGLEKKNDDTYSKGIEELKTDLKAGTDANIYLGTDDIVYELDVHKHRNNDCYYHIGFAYEMAAILNRKIKLPNNKYNTINETIEKHLTLNVETSKCPYYCAKLVSNVKVKESPDFIKKRLLSVGMRPINNVVDISNYVMLEYGQPLHFFDKDKLGNKILVRNAFKDEIIITLDGIKRVLDDKDIVISDGVKPVCIAGVMGGANTEVDENTTDILIESAIFDAVSIRYTASKLDLKSEASIRYGKGLNYEYSNEAIDRACYLLEKYADAKIFKGILQHDVIDKKQKSVKFETKEISSLLGIDLCDKDITNELNRLGFPFTLENDLFKVIIPNRRLDIDENVNDIAEEIGRLYGYHNLVSNLPSLKSKKGVYVGDVKIRKETSKRLRSLGLNEVKTYSLVNEQMAKEFNYENKKQIKIPNPMTIDKLFIRTTLLPSLINTYEYNKARSIKNILLYEISKTYDTNYVEDSKVGILACGNYLENEWQKINLKCDFYYLKGIIENLLNYLGFKNRYGFKNKDIEGLHPFISASIIIDNEEIGIIGRIHPNSKKEDIYLAELSMSKLYNKQIKPLKFKEANRYPEVIKDIAFVVDNNIESEIIKTQIKRSGGKLLSSCKEFDVYKEIRKGKKSIAYTLTFKDESKTLIEEDVMLVFNKIIKEVEEKTGAKLRNDSNLIM